LRLIENLNSFQTVTRKEISSLRDKIGYIEDLVERLSKSVEQSISMNASHITTQIPEPIKTEEISDANLSWSKIVELLSLAKYNDAYNLAISQKNNFTLLRLMGKTGIIIEKLDPQLAENLVIKIIELLESGEFIEFLLGWIIAVVDRKINLVSTVRNNLIKSLGNLCENEGSKGRLDEMQMSEANRVFNILKGMNV